METKARVHTERDGDVLVVVIDHPPVNAGSLEVRRGLLDAVHALSADDALQAAVLIGAGTTFIAGSDLREFGRPLEDPQLPAVIAAIEDCGKPVVAALHGAALGGGFELALGCDARVASPDTVVGLPEVTLGMIPGAGGTQRLPRCVGVPRAIALVCSAERVPAAQALELGIVDAVVGCGLREAAVAHARSLAGRKRRLRDLGVPAADPAAVDAAEAEALWAGRQRPHVAAAIAAVKSAATLAIDEALARERAVFTELRLSREAFALRHLFFAERDAARRGVTSGDAWRAIGERVIGACRRACERMRAHGATQRQVEAALAGFGLSPSVDEDVAVPASEARAWRDVDLRHGMLRAMADEALRLVADGVVAKPADVDVVMVRHHGFPRWEGGPVFWASQG